MGKLCKNCEYYKKDKAWSCYNQHCFVETTDPKDGRIIRSRKKDENGGWYDYLTFNSGKDCIHFSLKIRLWKRIIRFIMRYKNELFRR